MPWATLTWSLNVDIPVTFKLAPIPTSPETANPPVTSNSTDGKVLPIPTLPPPLIVNLSTGAWFTPVLKTISPLPFAALLSILSTLKELSLI